MSILADPYVNARSREFDRQNRDFQNHRQYEDALYRSHVELPLDPYSQKYITPASNTQAQSIRQASSPPPSSSTLVQEHMKEEGEARRSLHLDKTGQPTGKMVSLFRSDIVSFVKEMDPTQGWEGQTREVKDRLLSRLMHSYEVYGDSRKLSEKYLRK